MNQAFKILPSLRRGRLSQPTLLGRHVPLTVFTCLHTTYTYLIPSYLLIPFVDVVDFSFFRHVVCSKTVSFVCFLDETTSSTLRSELPEEESNILGRTKEIDQIVRALSGKRENTTAGVLVSGAPGVGKSTVAIQAGHRLKNEFGKTVKFCPLRGAGSGGSEVREILNVCAVGYQQTNENPRYVLRNWCRGLQDDLILILDNAEDALENSDAFMSLLQDMRTFSDRKVKFLITWRLSDINNPTTGLDFQPVKIGPLGQKESIEVLMNGAGLTNDKPEAQVKLNKIAELCENNPLALRLAGPLLAEDSEYTFAELIKELQENATKPLRLNRVMAVAFERLNEPLKHALVGLSVFTRSFGRDAARALLGINCADHLRKLKQRCLIQRQGSRYLIHLLIRAYARQMGKGRRLKAIVAHCKQRFLEYFLSLILRYAKEYWGKDTCKVSLCQFNEERLNLESTLTDVGQRKLRSFKELDGVVDACGLIAPYIEDCVPSKLYVCFLNGLRRFSEDQNKITKQVEILWLLYDESRRHGGDREKSKGLIEQAIKLHQDNLSSFEQDSLSEICYLSQYGRYLSQDCRKRDEAQPLLRKAVLMFEEEKERYCTSTFDMGRVLSQMGHNERMDKAEDEIRHEEALTCYQEALSFRQSHYGEHVVTALAHKDLADYYLFIEDFGKAEENYKAAERIFDELEMMKQKEAVPTYKNFGRCFEKSGKIREARLKFEMGRDVAEATIEGSDKWKVAINTYLALLLYKHYADEVSKAVRITQDVFQMAKELNLKSWQDKEELEAFYNRYRDLVNTD